MNTTSGSTKENKLKEINKALSYLLLSQRAQGLFNYLRFFVSDTIRDKAPSTTAAMER
jgi:hypothetical protein